MGEHVRLTDGGWSTPFDTIRTWLYICSAGRKLGIELNVFSSVQVFQRQ